MYSSVHKYFNINILMKKAFREKLNISVKKNYREVSDYTFQREKLQL